MPAVILQQSDASASCGGTVPVSPFLMRRKRRRTVKRIVLSVFALAWIAGCIVVLSRVISAVGIKCAGCPECLTSAP
jgi:hypothetical protein